MNAGRIVAARAHVAVESRIDHAGAAAAAARAADAHGHRAAVRSGRRHVPVTFMPPLPPPPPRLCAMHAGRVVAEGVDVAVHRQGS